MIKMIALIKRIEGTTYEEFRNYYENNHIPLAEKHTPNLLAYQRNFILSHLVGPDQFDCITEFWFDYDDDYMEKQRAQNIQSDVAIMMGEDEARFIDRSKSQFFIVEEQNSPPENLLGNRGRSEG